MARDPVRTVRIEDALWDAMRADLDKHNQGPINRWLTLSEWVRLAIKERLRARAHSRSKRRKKKEGGK